MKTILFLLLTWSAPVWALSPGDAVVARFADGSVVTGTLADLSGNMLQMDVAGTRLAWPLDSVRSLDAAPASGLPYGRPQRAVLYPATWTVSQPFVRVPRRWYRRQVRGLPCPYRPL